MSSLSTPTPTPIRTAPRQPAAPARTFADTAPRRAWHPDRAPAPVPVPARMEDVLKDLARTLAAMDRLLPELERLLDDGLGGAASGAAR